MASPGSRGPADGASLSKPQNAPELSHPALANAGAQTSIKAVAANISSVPARPQIEQLQAVDTAGVEPMAGGGAVSLRMREDVVTDGGMPEQVLAELRDRGHKVVDTLGQTSANSIAVGPYGPLGAPDPRTRGAWAEGQ